MGGATAQTEASKIQSRHTIPSHQPTFFASGKGNSAGCAAIRSSESRAVHTAAGKHMPNLGMRSHELPGPIPDIRRHIPAGGWRSIASVGSATVAMIVRNRQLWPLRGAQTGTTHHSFTHVKHSPQNLDGSPRRAGQCATAPSKLLRSASLLLLPSHTRSCPTRDARLRLRNQ